MQPIIQLFFKFSFYIGSFFFSLFFFKNKRETIIYCKQGFLQRFWIREGLRPPNKGFEYGAPKGFNEQRFLQPIIQIYFQIFTLYWFILFLSLFFDEQERNGFLLKTRGFQQGIWTRGFQQGIWTKEGLRPRRGSMNKGFCNPSTKYIFRFSFYLGSFFFSLFFFKNKREMFFIENKGFSTTLSTKLFATLSTKSLYSFWIKGSPLTNSIVPLRRGKYT